MTDQTDFRTAIDEKIKEIDSMEPAARMESAARILAEYELEVLMRRYVTHVNALRRDVDLAKQATATRRHIAYGNN